LEWFYQEGASRLFPDAWEHYIAAIPPVERHDLISAFHRRLTSDNVDARLAVPSGPGIRDDSGVYEGWEVPVYYDPLLAKLCVWGETREAAIRRLKRALDEYNVAGIRTTLPFFRSLVRSEDFRRANFDTGFIDRLLSEGGARSESPAPDDLLTDIAAIAAVLHTRSKPGSAATPAGEPRASRWKTYNRLGNRLS
ncbi:MAG TPA: hypothetical protein VJQ56_09625, partial [Blastocatellia bacterium]|nr:hypothetical protein [Blastocatellia bacterium]